MTTRPILLNVKIDKPVWQWHRLHLLHLLHRLSSLFACHHVGDDFPRGNWQAVSLDGFPFAEPFQMWCRQTEAHFDPLFHFWSYLEDFDFQILSRKGISAFIFDQSWQEELDSITLVTSASYEVLSRQGVLCCHRNSKTSACCDWTRILCQRSILFKRRFPSSHAGFLSSQPSKNHQCVLGCCQFQNEVSGFLLLVLLRFVNAVVVKVRGKDP